MAAETADQQRAALRQALRQLQERHLARVQAYSSAAGLPALAAGRQPGGLQVRPVTACDAMHSMSCTSWCVLYCVL